MEVAAQNCDLSAGRIGAAGWLGNRIGAVQAKGGGIMKQDAMSRPADHLISLLEHAREKATHAGLMEVCFIVELALAATLETAGEREACPGSAVG